MPASYITIIRVSIKELAELDLSTVEQVILLISSFPETKASINRVKLSEVAGYIENECKFAIFSYIGLLSAIPKYKEAQLNTALYDHILSGPGRLNLISSYKAPPVHSYSVDEPISAVLTVPDLFDNTLFRVYLKNWEAFVYQITRRLLNTEGVEAIQIWQIDRPSRHRHHLIRPTALDQAALIIPHKGNPLFLQRCFQPLRKNELLPAHTMVCFDDRNYLKLCADDLLSSSTKVSLYRNSPANSGPYQARHAAMGLLGQNYIFFQDSDDISLPNRFALQMNALKERKLDLIGSHELRIDELEKKILVVRFPLDVNASMEKYAFHPLFHPTSLITKEAYERVGGFSTDLRFGYDSQFLLRAFFFLRIGNIDEILYVRFRRKGSLTTHHKTRIGSSLRSFLIWRWKIDFRLVLKNKLTIEESSLNVSRSRYPFRLIHLSFDDCRVSP